MMSKRILALDMATCTGWATSTSSGTENFRKRAGDSRGMIYIRFEAWLVDVGGIIEPELIVYERPHARGRAANELLNGMLAILQKYCEQCRVEFTDCPSTTVKKFATGKGNASKEDMMAEYRKRWGVDPLDDNEADARWLLEWAQDQFNNRRSEIETGNTQLRKDAAPKRRAASDKGKSDLAENERDDARPARRGKKADQSREEGCEKKEVGAPFRTNLKQQTTTGENQ